MGPKIKRGDTVEVVSGNEAGARGEVLRVLPHKNRLVVQGLNIRKKHQKQMQTGGQRQLPSGIIEFEGTMHLSNVMVVCPSCDEPTRVGIQREDGRRVRVCRKCEGLLD
ncbi:MAG: 50S ribosomal protein L24 [Anaerolineales bacterium]